MPAMYVGPYAQNDAEITLDLWNHLSTQLTKEELWPIANLELKLLPCLMDMTWRGVRVDQDRVERTRNTLLKKKDVLAKIKRAWPVWTWSYGPRHLSPRHLTRWAYRTRARRKERPVIYQIVSDGP